MNKLILGDYNLFNLLLLPNKAKEEGFYVDFTKKWLFGLLVILLLFGFFINLF